MNYKKLLLAILTIYSFSANAQNEIDALRYSQQNMFGSARVSSMGGAFGSLGGDFSGLSQNPAGIGMYQFTEVTFSPTFILNNTTSYGNTNNLGQSNDGKFDEDISQGGLGNIGFIFSKPKDNTEWKRINFGIGLNQLANYDKNIYINTINNSSSLADNLLSVAQGKKIDKLDDFFGYPSWFSYIIDNENYLIENDTAIEVDDGNYISNIKSTGQKRQTHQLNSNGEMHEFVISAGTSYEDKLYLGATVGIPTFEYSEIINHREDIITDTINNLSSFEYKQNLYASGEGINIKIGGIYRVNKNIKLGGALHSPTIFTIQEEFRTITESNFTSDTSRNTNSYESPVNLFEYELITPWKAIASVSANINKNIIISCDYEIIDYTNSSLNSKNYRNDDGTEIFASENNTIDNIYHKSENIRLGLELKADPFSLRAGYARYSSPFKNNDELSRENFSFGAGVNYGSYYFDLAYVLSQAHDQYQMYNEEFINPTELVYTNHNLVITLGFRY